MHSVSKLKVLGDSKFKIILVTAMYFFVNKKNCLLKVINLVKNCILQFPITKLLMYILIQDKIQNSAANFNGSENCSFRSKSFKILNKILEIFHLCNYFY